MKSVYNKLVFLALAVCTLGTVAAAQNRTTFSDPGADFTFEIPDDTWKVVGKSPMSLVYTTANDGDLEIRKLTLPANRPLGDLIKAEEEKLKFSSGFVPGKDENFSGALHGAVVQL